MNHMNKKMFLYKLLNISHEVCILKFSHYTFEN